MMKPAEEGDRRKDDRQEDQCLEAQQTKPGGRVPPHAPRLHPATCHGVLVSNARLLPSSQRGLHLADPEAGHRAHKRVPPRPSHHLGRHISPPAAAAAATAPSSRPAAIAAPPTARLDLAGRFWGGRGLAPPDGHDISPFRTQQPKARGQTVQSDAPGPWVSPPLEQEPEGRHPRGEVKNGSLFCKERTWDCTLTNQRNFNNVSFTTEPGQRYHSHQSSLCSGHLQEAMPQESSLYPQGPSPPRPCPLHRRRYRNLKPELPMVQKPA
ncbi:uncharacterized protein [Narcine bancroftii]|uniref:uncharacterized protein n=1 Tax=Narcine bancroftii TaxID=1343680 RepID=UPI0038322A6D